MKILKFKTSLQMFKKLFLYISKPVFYKLFLTFFLSDFYQIILGFVTKLITESYISRVLLIIAAIACKEKHTSKNI